MHAVSIEQAQMLPLFHRITIPEDYIDIMGHMNIRWYLAIFDTGAWGFFESLGMTEQYYRENNTGGFALQQFIRYLNEVRVSETVAVHGRLVGRSEKRIHFMLFMVNETKSSLAATIETLGSHADLRVRRTSPYPPTISQTLDMTLAAQSALGWDAPTCGAIKP